MLAAITVATAGTFRMKIVIENGMPFITVGSNQTKRPLKLLVDTGAMSTVIAEDTLKRTAKKYGNRINILGNNNNETEFWTYGLVDIFLPREFGALKLPVCVMDRNHFGGGILDGVLGFDLMDRHRMRINTPIRRIEYFVGDSGAGTSSSKK